MLCTSKCSIVLTEIYSGGSRISEKGGPAFFFFFFAFQQEGGGDNFAKKKKQTIGVFLTVQVFIKTYS